MGFFFEIRRLPRKTGYVRIREIRPASEMDGTGLDKETENGASENKRDKNKGSSKDISEEDDPEVEKSKGLRQTENDGSIWLRLKRDKLYREKYILTMAYFLSFLMLVCFNKHCL